MPPLTKPLENLFAGYPGLLSVLILIWLAVTAVALAVEPTAGMAIAVCPILVVWLSLDRNNMVLLFLFILPFSNALILGDNVLGIQGAKVSSIVAVLIFISMLFDNNLFTFNDVLEKKALLLFGAYVLVFVMIFARSVPNSELFYVMEPRYFSADRMSYVLSYGVRPLTYLLPFFVILKRARSLEAIHEILAVIGLSIFVFSCLVLAVVFSHVSVLSDPSRTQLAVICQYYFGLHYNDIGTIYSIVCAPLLYLAIRGGLFWRLNFFLLIAIVLIIESRTTLIDVALVSAVYLVLQRKRVLLMAAGGAAAVIAPFVLLPSLATLFSVGLTSNQDVTADALFSGRIVHIWVPLLGEWFSSPMLLLFGAGRFGILTSPLMLVGEVLSVGHAHNAFIDFFIDSGLPLLVALVVALVYFLRRGWVLGTQFKSPLYWAVYLSVVSYMIQTVTGTSIYPTLDNMELFPLVAILVNLVRVGHARMPANPRKSRPMRKLGGRYKKLAGATSLEPQ
jgi:O-Antigen ligase